MPVDLGWLCEKRVMLVRFEGVISDTDMNKMDNFLLDGFNTTTFPIVHVIIDTRAITVQNNLRDSLRMKSNRHARRGWVMTVGALKNPAIRLIVGTLTTMFQVRHRDVESPFDALDILQRVDPSMPDLTSERASLAAFYAESVR